MITTALLSPALDVTYLVDHVEIGAIHRPDSVLRLPGGKGLNLARAARQVGGRARVIAPLGGRIGELVRDLADAAGVEVDVVAVGTETRTCVTVADAEGLTEFYEPSGVLAPSEVAAVLAALVAAPADGWTALSGSVPATVPLDDLADALLARRAAGEAIALDTHGAALAALLEAVHPELVKINRLEAVQLLGDKGRDGDAGAESTSADPNALDLARALRELTGGAVVVTDGIRGAAAIDDSGSWRAEPHPEPGLFSVGSGDTFLGVLLASRERGADLGAALAEASAAAAANTARPGAAEFTDDDLARARSLTTVVAA